MASPTRFTRSQRATIIVCAPVRLTPGVLAHTPAPPQHQRRQRSSG
ncbi:hypothetical protein [Salinispora arenicola]|nr:hypothetical protein [Salinispora arenicola]MCN0152579.1 hypothetical protein [Salinispora arenicola]